MTSQKKVCLIIFVEVANLTSLIKRVLVFFSFFRAKTRKDRRPKKPKPRPEGNLRKVNN